MRSGNGCLRSGYRTCDSVPGLTTASKSSNRRDEPINAASFSLRSMGLSKVPMTYSIGHNRLGKWEILQKPSGVDREYAQAWYNLGDLLDDQGRPDAAIECLRRALRVAPDYADAMFNLALLLQRRNHYTEAADYWRRYLASDCQSEWAMRARRSLKFCEMQGYLIAST